MDINAIAGSAASMRMGALRQSVGIEVMRTAMDIEQQGGDNVVKLLESIGMPYLGGNIDIKV